MSQQNLALAANPQMAQQIAGLGGSLPNLAQAVAGAEAEQMKSIMESATAAAAAILQSSTARATELVNSKVALERSLADVQKKSEELKKARDYFSATNNIFPLQKLLGIPTSKDILTRFPDIEKIPEGWTAPVADTSAAA